MPSFVAFLRAVNLGPTRKFPMAELRACLESAGFEGCETYIQSGNARFSCSMRSPSRVADRLEELFEEDRGFPVPTVVLTPAQLREVYDDAVSLETPLSGQPRRYVTLLRAEPTPKAVEAIESLSLDGEAARVRGRAVHVWVRDGYQNARLNNARIEKLCGVATTRDLKVVTTLAQRWGA